MTPRGGLGEAPQVGDAPRSVKPSPVSVSEAAGRAVERVAPGPDPLVGRVINDRFRIVAMVARGGMGKVYRAEQSPLGRLVALKVLNPNYSGDADPEFHKRFFLEASVCAKLTHPNTVTIFDYGRTEDDVYYIAMELLEGRTLYRTMREEGPFAPDRAMHITRQICRSLREAHGLGLIHRDLKPANVFLVKHGDEVDFVKVLDFGLVKDIDDKSESITQTGLFMGSPKYMAPEQIRGEEVDGRCDVYALGVLMFEMLTGRVPFDRSTSVNTLMAHVQEQVPSMSEIAPDVTVPPVLERFVLKCLEKNPDARFGSMDEVLIGLRTVAEANGMSVPTSGEGRTSSMSGDFRRDLSSGPYEQIDFTASTTGSLPTRLSGSGAASLPPSLPSAAPSAAPAPLPGATPASGSKLPLLLGAGLIALVLAGGGLAMLALGGGKTSAPMSPQASDAGSALAPLPPAARVTVVLRSSPPGAMVRVGDRDVGLTPVEVEWTGDDAAQGRQVSLVFHHEGYADLAVVRSLAGARLEVSATLEPVVVPSLPTSPLPVRPVRPTGPRHPGGGEPGEPVGPFHGFKNDPY